MNRKESLVEYAHKEILKRIQNNELSPGAKVNAVELANSLNISRTPVIAAINQLIAQGFIEKDGAKSAIVTKLNLSQVREIIQVREMIEYFTIDLIIKNAPFCLDKLEQLEAICRDMRKIYKDNYRKTNELETKFHLLFISLCCNSKIIEFYNSNWGIGIMFLLFTRSKMPIYQIENSLDQHELMIKYTREGNAAKLKEVIQNHLSIINNTLSWLMNNGGNEIFKF